LVLSESPDHLVILDYPGRQEQQDLLVPRGLVERLVLQVMPVQPVLLVQLERLVLSAPLVVPASREILDTLEHLVKPVRQVRRASPETLV
jgi:hypothetical protein